MRTQVDYFNRLPSFLNKGNQRLVDQSPYHCVVSIQHLFVYFGAASNACGGKPQLRLQVLFEIGLLTLFLLGNGGHGSRKTDEPDDRKRFTCTAHFDGSSVRLMK